MALSDGLASFALTSYGWLGLAAYPLSGPMLAYRAAKGKEAFNASGCSGCHGPDGKGMHALGAPNLTDKVWLYGSSEATIVETITNGRNNKMPAWKEFLGDAKVHLLSAYVLSLSQGAK